jgi:hypothetical protein
MKVNEAKAKAREIMWSYIDSAAYWREQTQHTERPERRR